MELQIAKIGIGEMLVLPPDWKGYNLKPDVADGVWLKDAELRKIGFAYFKKYDPIKHAKVLYGLSPFALCMTANVIIKTFESCQDKRDKENMVISRGIVSMGPAWPDLLEAYLLVGNILEEYEFDTIEITDDSTHDWHKRWGKI